MRAERLFRALGLVDPALVEEALSARRWPWRRWAALAAALALAAGLGFSRLGGGGWSSGSGASSGDTGGAGSAGSAEEGFMSYAGPVLPLTTAGDPAGLTAEREVVWDFAPGAGADGSPRQWGAGVTDRYVLSNPTDGDVAVTALYPFAGSLGSLEQVRPAVTVDGRQAEADLYAGPCAGAADALNSWAAYSALLGDRSYPAQALEDPPALDIPATVYAFSDFHAPLEEYPAATQAMTLTIDQSRTRIFTYGLNGLEQDTETGWRRYSYFVPGEGRDGLKLLIVLGDDIGDGYTLQGYQDGGCDREIEGVSCAVTRTETTLGAVLERLCRHYAERQAGGAVPLALYSGAAARQLLSGPLSAAGDQGDGRLDDILGETLSRRRVLYLALPVTVPAGGSAAVEFRMWKAPSFDHAGTGSARAGLQGFDLAARLGSGLEFTSLRAALTNAEGVALTEQDFGFDPEGGCLAVQLDPARERFCLEFRPLE